MFTTRHQGLIVAKPATDAKVSSLQYAEVMSTDENRPVSASWLPVGLMTTFDLRVACYDRGYVVTYCSFCSYLNKSVEILIGRLKQAQLFLPKHV